MKLKHCQWIKRLDDVNDRRGAKVKIRSRQSTPGYRNKPDGIVAACEMETGLTVDLVFYLLSGKTSDYAIYIMPCFNLQAPPYRLRSLRLLFFGLMSL